MKRLHRHRMRVILMAGLLMLLPIPAFANGAMGLALSIFTWPMWLVYVVATVLFEAWAMGRGLRLPFSQALRLSFWANLLTAVVGGFFSGIIGYSFFGMFGSRLN